MSSQPKSMHRVNVRPSSVLHKIVFSHDCDAFDTPADDIFNRNLLLKVPFVTVTNMEEKLNSVAKRPFAFLNTIQLSVSEGQLFQAVGSTISDSVSPFRSN